MDEREAQFKELKITVVAAATGTGKTLSYLLPMLQRLKEIETREASETTSSTAENPKPLEDSDESKEHSDVALKRKKYVGGGAPGQPRMIIIAPSAFLADQIGGVCKTLCYSIKLRSRVYTRSSKSKILQRIEENFVDILVTTPQYLMDSPFSMKSLQFLVFDEADTVLESRSRETILQPLLLWIERHIKSLSLSSSSSNPIDPPASPLQQIVFVCATVSVELKQLLLSMKNWSAEGNNRGKPNSRDSREKTKHISSGILPAPSRPLKVELVADSTLHYIPRTVSHRYIQCQSFRHKLNVLRSLIFVSFRQVIHQSLPDKVRWIRAQNKKLVIKRAPVTLDQKYQQQLLDSTEDVSLQSAASQLEGKPPKIVEVSARPVVDIYSRNDDHASTENEDITTSSFPPSSVEVRYTISSAVMIFCNSISTSEAVHQFLSQSCSVHAVLIHGRVPFKQCKRSLDEFRKGMVRIIVCTDLASRGLDFPNVDHVIMFDFPFNAVDYLHRTGRTSRMGRPGHVTCLLSPRLSHEVALARNIRLAIEGATSLAGVSKIPSGGEPNSSAMGGP